MRAGSAARALCFFVLVIGTGCSHGTLAGDANEPPDATVADRSPADQEASRPDASADTPGAPSWDPRLPDTALLGARRGLQIARGIIHAHSVNSHDACDDDPQPDGKPNEACLDDLRHAMCTTRLDFLMLTEHISMLAELPYDGLLLERPGDRMIEKDGQAVAVAVSCPDEDREVLLMPGAELDVAMPLGLERHIEGDPAELPAVYSGTDPSLAAKLRAAGAVVMGVHIEKHPVDLLEAHDLDGLEIYNLHLNLDPQDREEYLGLEPLGYIEDIAPFGSTAPDAPVPDLVFLAFFYEYPNGIDRWNALLAKRPTAGVLGTDAHQNVLPVLWTDGERFDSYRRMFRWFSNHALVAEPTYDAVKDAVRRGRGYMVFEILGTPLSFDFHADTTDGASAEMGDEVALSAGPVLEVARPSVVDQPPGTDAPEVTLQLLRIDDAGKVHVVAEGNDDIRHPVTDPGAYRAEVRIVPHHLAPFLGPAAGTLIKKTIWIYANPIYVR